jgi:alpha/beta superfamily hydrolase
LKKHKPWLDEEFSKLLVQRTQAEFQWLQDRSEINGINLRNVRRAASGHFRNKKSEYLEDKINEL